MAEHIQFMHELNSRILFHSFFSHILFLPALPHPNIICKAFRAFHPVCFHCVPLDESQVHDSHLFVLKGQWHPCFINIMHRSLELQNRFQNSQTKFIQFRVQMNVSNTIKSSLRTQIQAWTFKVTLFKINLYLLKI